MQRIVRTPTGEIVADASGRAAGRGAYVCRTGTCLETALAKGGLSRALKTPIPADVRATLAGTLMTDTMQMNELMIEGGTSGQE